MPQILCLVLFCCLCWAGILHADVEFRAAWQGEYLAISSDATKSNAPESKADSGYIISISDCKENLCTFTLSQTPAVQIPATQNLAAQNPAGQDSAKARAGGENVFRAKLRLLDYTKAEMLEHSCQLEALNLRESDDPAPQIPLHMQAYACKIDSAPQIAALLGAKKENTESSIIWQRVRVYPSFECKKARTSNEHTICGAKSIALPLLDIMLNDMYALLLESKDHKQIRAEQKLWFKELAKCDGDEPCLQERYERRILELEERYCQECE